MDPQIEARIAMAMHGISMATIGTTITTISGYAEPQDLRSLAYMVRDIADDMDKLADIVCGSIADDIIEKSKGFTA